jgi:hypothetical protein
MPDPAPASFPLEVMESALQHLALEHATSTATDLSDLTLKLKTILPAYATEHADFRLCALTALYMLYLALRVQYSVMCKHKTDDTWASFVADELSKLQVEPRRLLNKTTGVDVSLNLCVIKREVKRG